MSELEFRDGQDALQVLVNAKATLRAADRFRERLSAMRDAIDRSEQVANARVRAALTALEGFAEEAPEQLYLRVADGQLQKIAQADEQVSQLEREVAKLVERASQQGGAA